MTLVATLVYRRLFGFRCDDVALYPEIHQPTFPWRTSAAQATFFQVIQVSWGQAQERSCKWIDFLGQQKSHQVHQVHQVLDEIVEAQVAFVVSNDYLRL